MNAHIITSDDQMITLKPGDSVNLKILCADGEKVEMGCGFQTKYLLFEDALDLVACLVSGNPQLFTEDGDWIKDLISKIKSTHGNENFRYRSVNIDDLYGNIYGRDPSGRQEYLAIGASRLFYVVDLIDAFLYGGEIGDFETKNKKPKFKLFARIMPLVGEGDEVAGFSRNVAKELRNINFRKYLSSACYDEYKVALKDDSLDLFREISGYKNSGLYVAQLCNFYKSENYSLNGKFFNFLPTSKSHNWNLKLRFSFYPLLTVQFDARNYDENVMGYRVLVPLYCFMAGCNSYACPNEFTQENFEFFCDRDSAEGAIKHKYNLQEENTKSLFAAVNGHRANLLNQKSDC